MDRLTPSRGEHVVVTPAAPLGADRQSLGSLALAVLLQDLHRGRVDAVGSVQADPENCVFIGDSATDVLAGLLGGVAVIGHANKPGKAEALSQPGARAVVTDLAEVTTALRTAPSASSAALPN